MLMLRNYQLASYGQHLATQPGIRLAQRRDGYPVLSSDPPEIISLLHQVSFWLTGRWRRLFAPRDFRSHCGRGAKLTVCAQRADYGSGSLFCIDGRRGLACLFGNGLGSRRLVRRTVRGFHRQAALLDLKCGGPAILRYHMNVREVESQRAITNPTGFDIYIEQRTFA